MPWVCLLFPHTSTSSNQQMPSPDPLPVYERDTTPLSPPSPLITEHVPPGPQPGINPGPDWHPNIVTDGVIHQMLISDGNDAITIAPFLCIDLSDGVPHIEG